jgi:NAD(P)-dependent dehydrogenase (short-subunit alcohol dehydrogenase family)
VAHYIPMRRRGRPEDIAPLVVFLASNASSYLSGQVYFVDGGLMARS